MRLTASGLMIPSRIEEEPKYVCNVPGCGHKFYDGEEQARVRHALMHASQDEDHIQDAIRSPSADIMGEGDPERQEYLKRRHRQLVKEVGPKEANNPERY